MDTEPDTDAVSHRIMSDESGTWKAETTMNNSLDGIQSDGLATQLAVAAQWHQRRYQEEMKNGSMDNISGEIGQLVLRPAMNGSGVGVPMGGNSMLSPDTYIGLSILYALTALLSIVGNILAIIVFARGKRSRTDLRPFLMNLAVSDLLMAVFCMPFTFADAIFGEWPFSAPMCPVVLFVQMLSVASSVYTNVAIGVDRFLVVTIPLRHRFTLKKSKYVISAIWLASSVLASVQGFVARGHVTLEAGIQCAEEWPSDDSKKVYTLFLLVLIYIIPLIVLTVTYSVVGLLLWKRTAPGNRDHLRDFLQWRSKIKVVKMLVIVVAIFGVCWLPLHVFSIAIDFYPEMTNYSSHTEEKMVLGLFLGAHWLAMSNSFANPIIYGFTNDSFRADLLTLFYQWFPCCSCIKSILRRTNSRVTRDSVIFRRSTLLRSTGSNSSKKLKFQKRVWSSLHQDRTLIRKQSDLCLCKNYDFSTKRKLVPMNRRHTICNMLVAGELTDSEKATVNGGNA